MESIKDYILYWNNRYWDPDEETSGDVACFPRFIRGDAKNIMCSVWLQKQNAQNIHMMGMTFPGTFLLVLLVLLHLFWFCLVFWGWASVNKTVIPRTVRTALNEVPIQRRGRNRKKKNQKIICGSLPWTSLHIKWAQLVFFFLIHFKINFYISVHILMIRK